MVKINKNLCDDDQKNFFFPFCVMNDQKVCDICIDPYLLIGVRICKSKFRILF